MQCGARFSFFGDRSMVQHGLNEGVKHMYKTNAILFLLKMKGTPGAATKWIPKNTISTKSFENECLVRSPWGSLAST